VKNSYIDITVKKIALRSNEGHNATVMLSLPEGSTVHDALTKLNMPASDSHATLLNEKPVPANARGKISLKHDDILTIFPPLKGG